MSRTEKEKIKMNNEDGIREIIKSILLEIENDIAENTGHTYWPKEEIELLTDKYTALFKEREKKKMTKTKMRVEIEHIRGFLGKNLPGGAIGFNIRNYMDWCENHGTARRLGVVGEDITNVEQEIANDLLEFLIEPLFHTRLEGIVRKLENIYNSKDHKRILERLNHYRSTVTPFLRHPRHKDEALDRQAWMRIVEHSFEDLKSLLNEKHSIEDLQQLINEDGK